MDNIKDIKDAIKAENAVIGTELTIKNLKQGKLSVIYLTSNAPNDVVEEINYLAGINKTEVVKLDVPNDEFGIICRKPFPISVLSVVKV